MCHINALFNELLLNSKENFNAENFDAYTEYIKRIMTYFSDMKEAQLNRKFHGDKTHEVQFLDPITWRNARCAISGFVHFSGYLLQILPAKVEKIEYVPMLFDNQSPLERDFGGFRGSNKDRADNILSEINSQMVVQGAAMMEGSNSYTASDCTTEKEKYVTGTAKFTAHDRDAKAKYQKWGQLRDNHKKSIVNTPSVATTLATTEAIDAVEADVATEATTEATTVTTEASDATTESIAEAADAAEAIDEPLFVSRKLDTLVEKMSKH